MIAPAVLADHVLDVVHLADWPDRARCGLPVRYVADEHVTAEGVLIGRLWAVGRCLLAADHDQPCWPEVDRLLLARQHGSSGAAGLLRGWGKPGGWVGELVRLTSIDPPPDPVTVCGLPMPASEPWVRLDARDDDPMCPDCVNGQQAEIVDVPGLWDQ